MMIVLFVAKYVLPRNADCFQTLLSDFLQISYVIFSRCTATDRFAPFRNLHENLSDRCPCYPQKTSRQITEQIFES